MAEPVPGLVAVELAVVPVSARWRELTVMRVPVRRELTVTRALVWRTPTVMRVPVGRPAVVDGQDWIVTRELHISGGATGATLGGVPPRSVCDLRVSADPDVAGCRLHLR